MSVTRKFLQHVVPGVVKPMRVLWNQIIGFIFLVLTIGTVPTLIREYQAFQGTGEGFLRLGMTGGFAALMIYFATTSFLRARRLSK